MELLTIVCVWRMIDISGTTLSSLTFLAGCLSDWRIRVQLIGTTNVSPINLPIEVRAQFLKSLKTLEAQAQRMEMTASIAASKRAFDECLELLSAPIGYDSHRFNKIINHAERVVFSFMDEMQSRLVFVMSPRHAHFFSSDFPFGNDVADAFPSACYDIVESSKCRAIGRWTACVMHIMRVLEVGLRTFASHYGIEGSENWNAVLNQIEAKTREIGKKTHGAEQEQWAAEAGVHLRFIKNAWRNHAMHALEKYDEERAVAIFDNARSFMQHLAEKLYE